MNKIRIAVVLVVVLAAVFMVISATKTVPLGGELPASILSASTSTLNFATTTRLFTAKSFCDSRVIYSPDQTLYLTFGTPNLNVTGTIASSSLSSSTFHWRLATNTLTVFDSDTYGCGEWWATPSGTTTLIISEF